MLRVLAVDDEKPLLEELLYLLRSDPRVRSAEGAGDATEALRRITRALEGGPDGPDGIDVVFLDIHMAGLTGLDIARLLSGGEPPIEPSQIAAVPARAGAGIYVVTAGAAVLAVMVLALTIRAPGRTGREPPESS